jgi:hypothetical protein
MKKNKAQTIPVWNKSKMERRYRVLTRAELKSVQSKTIMLWFHECFSYLLDNEDYERAAVLRDSKARWVNQISAPNNKKAEL